MRRSPGWIASLMAKKGEPLTIPPDASTPSACNRDTAAVTVDRASASASCQIWIGNFGATAGAAPKTPGRHWQRQCRVDRTDDMDRRRELLGDLAGDGKRPSAISEPSSGTTIRETTTWDPHPRRACGESGRARGRCEPHGRQRCRRWHDQRRPGHDWPWRSSELRVVRQRHDLFVRLALCHHLLDRDLGSREQRRGLIHVRLGSPGPGVLNLLDSALGADEREERFGVAGCGGTTRSRTTVPSGPASFSAQGTARRARVDPSTGARTTVIQSAPTRNPTSRYAPRGRDGVGTSRGPGPRPRQGYLVPQRGDSLPARASSPRELHPPQRRVVEWNDRGIVCPDDQQSRGPHMFERLSRQVRATTAADDGAYAVGTSGRGVQGSRGAGAGAEQPNGQFASFRLRSSQSIAPVRRSASSPMSNRNCLVNRSTASSSRVRRSINRVPNPAPCKISATYRFRGEWRDEPLP